MTLILIEGIPGSGKSTFARFLANQFERNGHKCSLYLESTYEHPIIHSESFDDYNSFIDSYLRNWNMFLAKQYDEDTIVMDSAFLQSPIVHLLHKDVDRQIIKSLIMQVNEILSNVACSLIYLYQQDAEAAVQKMIEIRGREAYLIRKHNEYKHEKYFLSRQDQGSDSHISFFLDYAALANEIVNKVSIETLIIENSERNYELYEQQLLNAFSLIYFPDPKLEYELLESYIGTYHNQDMNFSVTIELINDYLMIFGNRKLKPKSSYQFYLDDMSVVATFIKESGKVIRLVISEKDLYANKNDNGSVFERVS
jgi:broad-specificity NMP kinase